MDTRPTCSNGHVHSLFRESRGCQLSWLHCGSCGRVLQNFVVFGAWHVMGIPKMGLSLSHDARLKEIRWLLIQYMVQKPCGKIQNSKQNFTLLLLEQKKVISFNSGAMTLSETELNGTTVCFKLLQVLWFLSFQILSNDHAPIFRHIVLFPR